MGAPKLTYYPQLKVLEKKPKFFLGVLEKKESELKNYLKTYKYRMHDPRIGRFFTVDPLAAKYPHYSQYAFSGNQVINSVEFEGLEPFKAFQIYNNDGEGFIQSGSKFEQPNAEKGKALIIAYLSSSLAFLFQTLEGIDAVKSVVKVGYEGVISIMK